MPSELNVESCDMIALYLVPRRFDVASTVRVEVTTDMQILCNWHKGKYCLISVSHDEVISDLSYLHFKVEGMDICCSKSLLAYVHLADYFWKNICPRRDQRIRV
jgi:hypothetical protein